MGRAWCCPSPALKLQGLKKIVQAWHSNFLKKMKPTHFELFQGQARSGTLFQDLIDRPGFDQQV